MKCQHCLVEIHFHTRYQAIQDDENGKWSVLMDYCPACMKQIIFLELMTPTGPNRNLVSKEKFLVYPRKVARSGCPPIVPTEFADDYKEACDVIDISPKASAALSRRCLQHILREEAGATQQNLAEQIQYVLDNCHFPSHIAKSIDGIRITGNFAAHTQKSTASGEIIEVEPGEAEWNLSVLESLFDYYFVQPDKTRVQREVLNKKLADAGKPPMK